MKHQRQSKLKMRNILYLVLFLSISLPVFSQDIISLKKGKRIEAFVVEITPTLVRYKLSNKLDARVYFTYKEDVFGILFQNGKVENFESVAKQKDKDEYSSEEIIQQSHNTLNKSRNLETGSYVDAIYLKKRKPLPLARKNSGLQPGYKCIIEQGVAIGVGDYGLDRFNFHVINGGQINPYFSIGGGIGINYYSESEDVIVPIFADFRFNFINNRISPFLSFDVGYSFLGDGFDGLGLFLSPTAGITFKTGRKFAIHIGTGFEAQQIADQNYSYYNGYTYNSSDRWSGALTFKVGISF